MYSDALYNTVINIQTPEGEQNARAYLTGVVSFGAGCAEKDYPGNTCNTRLTRTLVILELLGVYVPMDKFYNWIVQTVEDNPPVEYDEFMVCQDAQCT